MNRKGEKSKKNRKKTPHLEEKSYITGAKKNRRKIKGVIFQFFGDWARGKRWENSKVLYKKKLIYAKYFYAQIGDKNVATLHRKQKDSQVP